MRGTICSATVPAGALVCLLLFHAAAAAQIDVELKPLKAEIPWAGNVEFALTLTNSSDAPVHIEGLRVGPHHPYLVIADGPQDSDRIVRRTGRSGRRLVLGSSPVTLDPGESLTQSFLLCYDVSSCGNLPVGKHDLTLFAPTRIAHDDGFSPVYAADEIRAQLVVTAPVEPMPEQWTEFTRRLSRETEFAERIDLLAQFVAQHPTAPPTPTVRWSLLRELLEELHVDREETAAIAKRAADTVIEILNDDASPDALGRLAAESFLTHVGDDGPLSAQGDRVKEAIQAWESREVDD